MLQHHCQYLHSQIKHYHSARQIYHSSKVSIHTSLLSTSNELLPNRNKPHLARVQDARAARRSSRHCDAGRHCRGEQPPEPHADVRNSSARRSLTRAIATLTITAAYPSCAYDIPRQDSAASSKAASQGGVSTWEEHQSPRCPIRQPISVNSSTCDPGRVIV